MVWFQRKKMWMFGRTDAFQPGALRLVHMQRKEDKEVWKLLKGEKQGSLFHHSWNQFFYWFMFLQVYPIAYSPFLLGPMETTWATFRPYIIMLHHWYFSCCCGDGREHGRKDGHIQLHQRYDDDDATRTHGERKWGHGIILIISVRYLPENVQCEG